MGLVIEPSALLSSAPERGGVLIVDGEHLAALDIAQAFEEAGVRVVGVASSVEAALGLIVRSGRLDGAVLDLSLRGELAFPVADELVRRGVPFLFATAHGPAAIPSRFAHVTRCEKPISVDSLVALLLAQQGLWDPAQAPRPDQGQDGTAG